MKNEEHLNQVALFNWVGYMAHKHPELSNLFAIPNGGARHIAVARKLKAEGVKRGVPDIFLAHPMVRAYPGMGYYHGLFIELKSNKGKSSIEQADWLAKLNAAGYFAQICVGWVEAAKIICVYLGIKPEGL